MRRAESHAGGHQARRRKMTHHAARFPKITCFPRSSPFLAQQLYATRNLRLTSATRLGLGSTGQEPWRGAGQSLP